MIMGVNSLNTLQFNLQKPTKIENTKFNRCLHLSEINTVPKVIELCAFLHLFNVIAFK